MNFKEKILKNFPDMISGIKRFPITVLSGVIIFFTCLISVGNFHSVIDFIALLLLAIPLSASLELIFERCFQNKNKLITNVIIATITILFLSVFYLIYGGIIEVSPISKYAAMWVILFLIFLLIPIFNKENGEIYIQNVLTDLIFTIIFSASLFSALTAIFFTIQILIINISEYVYIHSFTFSIFIFGIIFFVSTFDKNNDFEENKISNENRIISYLLFPFMIIYTFILYLYLIKIILFFKIPNGEVINLVLWFIIFGLIMLIILKKTEIKSQIFSRFLKFFPILSIPLLLLALTSIFIRINQYGLTENRFYILTLCLWLIFCMFLHIVKIKKLNILTTIIISQIVILFSLANTPLTEVAVVNSQIKRLKSLLSINGMLKDGKIAENAEVNGNIKEEIENIKNYLDKKNIDTKEIFGKNIANIQSVKEKYADYTTENILNEQKIVAVKGFENVILNENLENPEVKNYKNNEFNIKIDVNNLIISRNESADELIKINFLELIKKIKNKAKLRNSYNNSDYYLLAEKDSEIILENPKIKCKIILKNIVIKNEKEVETINFDLFFTAK